MDRKELGEKIRHVRERRHLTQQNMADALGMSSAKQYSRYETGESKVDMELLEKIAHVFELTVVELMAYDESISFNQCTQQHVLGQHNTYHDGSDKERDQLLERIKHLEGEVEFLRKQLDQAMKV